MVQGDQPHGCVSGASSRRITRTDSAILPVWDNSLIKSPTRKYSGISNCEGGSLLPPIPPLAGVNGAATSRPASEEGRTEGVSVDNVRTSRKRNSRDQLMERTAPEWVGSACQFSPITELSTPDPSDTGTPDLIKDLSASVDGGSSDPQPNSDSSSDPAPPAWQSPAASLSPSGEELIMVLDFFPVPPPDPRVPVEGSGSPSSPFRAGVLTNGHNLVGQPQSGSLFPIIFDESIEFELGRLFRSSSSCAVTLEFAQITCLCERPHLTPSDFASCRRAADIPHPSTRWNRGRRSRTGPGWYRQFVCSALVVACDTLGGYFPAPCLPGKCEPFICAEEFWFLESVKIGQPSSKS